MPGTVITVPPPAGRDTLYSIAWTAEENWALVRGTIAARAPDRVTERMEVILKGDASAVCLHLDALGASFPLPEQSSGETNFPTPADLYWDLCVAHLPGEALDTPDYQRRIAFSLTRARSGWKIHCVEEVDEDRLMFEDYLAALCMAEMPDVRVVKVWQGRTIGDRNGVIRDHEILDALLRIGADTDTVRLLHEYFGGQEDEDETGDEEPARFGMVRMADEGVRALPVEVIALESPLRERLPSRRDRR
jgi:hypothetical protein